MTAEERTLRELLTGAAAFTRSVRDAEVEVLTGGTVSGLDLVGRVNADLPAKLRDLQLRVRHSVWNMQVSLPFFPEDPWDELNDRSRKVGHDTRLILSESAPRVNPLVSSQYPIVRVGPVPLSMIVLDEAAVVYAGVRDPSGETTVWLASRPEWVAAALAVWRGAWALSRPVLADPEAPPLNRRQYAVACFLAQGLGDEAIARRVGVSLRTVASDVRVVMDLLGAKTRFQAGNRLGNMRPTTSGE